MQYITHGIKLLYNSLFSSPSWLWDGIFRENYVNTITANALAPWVARASTVMILILKDVRVHIVPKEEFPLNVPFSFLEMKENISTLLYFLEKFQHVKGKMKSHFVVFGYVVLHFMHCIILHYIGCMCVSSAKLQRTWKQCTMTS